MPPWARRARLTVRHWRWSYHHHRAYRIQIWASLSLDDSTLINILQKSLTFILEQIWTFLLFSSSWCLHRTPSTRHLLFHIEHSSLERTPSVLIPFVVNEIDMLDTNYCVHNSGYHTYYDTNNWENTGSPPITSSTSWDRLPRAHKMNIKRYKKKNTQFNVVRSKFGLRLRGENLRKLY